MISQDLLEILVCPECKGPVKKDEGKKGLLCEKCGLLYPVQDGIPVMLVEKAQKLTA